MVKVLSRDAIQRMVKGQAGTTAVTEIGGGGGDMPDLRNYVTLPFLRSITWWGRALPEEGTDIVGALTGVTDITMTGAISGTTNLTMTGVISGATGLTMNNGAISGVTTLTASGLATVGSLRIGDAILEWDNGNNALKIRKSTGANDAVNVYATGGVSALGYASGGGGGGATALTDLVDVAISSPSSGQVLMYNSSTHKWYNGTVQSSGGTVTSITAGTGLSGGTITASGTIALSTDTQTNIGKGVTAYGWGNHANAGYLTSSDIADMATKTWVGEQGFVTSSGVTSVSTGTGLTGGPITSSGTISISSTYQTYISHGNTAYGWGNHADAGYLTSQSSIAFSQLPTMYWADVQVSNQSNNNTSPQFGNVRIKPGSASYGGYLRFGDGEYSYIAELADDELTYRVGTKKSHVFKTGTTTRFNIDKEYVSIVNKLRIGGTSGGFIIEVDSNGDLKFNGNIYATGGVSALGQSSGGSGGATALTDLVDVATSNVSNGQGLVYDSTSTKWKNATLFTAMSYQNSVLSVTVSGVKKQVTISSGGGGATTLAALTDTNISSPSSGQALIYNGSKWANSAISMSLGGLSNVVLSSPTNGQVLKYNGNNWVNANESGGGGGSSTLAGLTDVNIIGASGGEVLAYNSSTQKWENMTGYMEETGNSSMSGYFEPSSNGGAQLGRSSWRFSYMYGQHGNFSSDLIIGSIKLTYDSANNALKVQKTDGTAANLYALGSVSALGFGGGPSSTSISQLTITESLNFPGSSDINYDTDEDKLYFTTGGDGFVFNGDVEINGALNLYLGSGVMNIHGGYLHLNTGKYIYVSGTHLYFYNGSTTIKLA